MVQAITDKHLAKMGIRPSEIVLMNTMIDSLGLRGKLEHDSLEQRKIGFYALCVACPWIVWEDTTPTKISEILYYCTNAKISANAINAIRKTNDQGENSKTCRNLENQIVLVNIAPALKDFNRQVSSLIIKHHRGTSAWLIWARDERLMGHEIEVQDRFCGVCFDNIQRWDNAINLCLGPHFYHYECGLATVMTTGVCPQCKILKKPAEEHVGQLTGDRRDKYLKDLQALQQ